MSEQMQLQVMAIGFFLRWDFQKSKAATASDPSENIPSSRTFLTKVREIILGSSFGGDNLTNF